MGLPARDESAVCFKRKTQINLTFSQFCRDSTKEMQAFFCFRCSKIWHFTRLFVPLQAN